MTRSDYQLYNQSLIIKVFYLSLLSFLIQWNYKNTTLLFTQWVIIHQHHQLIRDYISANHSLTRSSIDPINTQTHMHTITESLKTKHKSLNALISTNNLSVWKFTEKNHIFKLLIAQWVIRSRILTTSNLSTNLSRIIEKIMTNMWVNNLMSGTTNQK